MASPRRILVTGAHGFVGLHLGAALRRAFPEAALALPRAAALDISDRRAVDAYVSELRPDACVHLAAVAAIPEARRDPDRAWRVNLHGTLALADALLKHAPECVLLYPSSADAYGRSFRAGVPVTERTPLAPMNIYGATKAAAELAVGAMAGFGLRCVVLRPFNHTGPGQSAEFVVAAFARQVARIAAGLQPPVLQVGALAPRRDFLDVRDVCAAYVAVLQRAEAIEPGAILNVASGISRRVGDVLDDLLALAGVHADFATEADRLRPSDIAVATGDAGAARAMLGWSPAVPWSATLADVLADWRGRVAEEARASA